jgi:hypothetical protein
MIWKLDHGGSDQVGAPEEMLKAIGRRYALNGYSELLPV